MPNRNSFRKERFTCAHSLGGKVYYDVKRERVAKAAVPVVVMEVCSIVGSNLNG